jgi:hypothetical protein
MQIGVIGLGRMDGNLPRRRREARQGDLDNRLRRRAKGTKQNLGALKQVGTSDSAPFIAQRRVFRWPSSPFSLFLAAEPVPTAPA